MTNYELILRFPHGEDVTIRTVAIPVARLMDLAEAGYAIELRANFPTTQFIVSLPPVQRDAQFEVDADVPYFGENACYFDIGDGDR